MRLVAALAALCAAVAPAHAASWFEKNFYLHDRGYDAVLPACGEPAVQQRIAARFAEKEARFWNSSLEIRDFGATRQIAFRPWGDVYIPRRYCAASVVLSNGRRTAVYYSIAEDQGMIGHSWGVEWCVVGKDRNLAFNPACKMARP
jgi:hypothetical protein